VSDVFNIKQVFIGQIMEISLSLEWNVDSEMFELNEIVSKNI